MKNSTCDGCIACVTQSEQVRDMLRDALWDCRFATEVFATPDQCLQSLGAHRYDLVLVDCGGDTPGALELVTRSRQMVRQIPAVLLVERGDVRAAVWAIQAGATDCVEKPVEVTRLIPALHAILSRTDSRGPDSGTALTRAESAVLHHTLASRTSREIGGILCRSHRTIEVQRRSIMCKFGVTRLVDLMRKQAALGRL